LIHPIPDFSEPEKTFEPQQKAPTTSIPKESQEKEPPPASIPKNLQRIPKTTSLKSLIKEPETNLQPISSEAQTQSTPFDGEDLIQCWDAYSEMIEEKPHFKNTMINCKPVLLDNFHFEVRVHNPAQKEELIRNSLDLLKLLRTRLKNDLIQMYIHIDENMGKKTVYTAAEKFEFLNNINPLLSKLIDEFDLTID